MMSNKQSISFPAITGLVGELEVGVRIRTAQTPRPNMIPFCEPEAYQDGMDVSTTDPTLSILPLI